VGGEAPARSPPAYVRGLFDPYAEDFDTHLLGELHYRGHEAVVQAATRAGHGRRWQHVLDLGCGTGLCGRALRSSAARIDGVDLSPTMVDAARRSGAYAELTQGDVADHLHRTPLRHDLVLSADVFIYIGDLDAVFAGVRRVLLPQGLFVFSVETLADDAAAGTPPGYVLRPSLRYAHRQDDLRRLAAAHGMAVVDWQPFVVREEQRQPVGGAVVTLRG
jgi:predicted TPR repeat methyltransferase